MCVCVCPHSPFVHSSSGLRVLGGRKQRKMSVAALYPLTDAENIEATAVKGRKRNPFYFQSAAGSECSFTHYDFKSQITHTNIHTHQLIKQTDHHHIFTSLYLRCLWALDAAKHNIIHSIHICWWTLLCVFVCLSLNVGFVWVPHKIGALGKYINAKIWCVQIEEVKQFVSTSHDEIEWLLSDVCWAQRNWLRLALNSKALF